MKRGGTDALLAAAVAALVLLRVGAAGRLPLFDDEAYYWLWSLRPDWGYLDHPPLIAWLIYAGTRVSDSPGWIRALPLVCGALTVYVLFLFARDLFGGRTALLAALVASVTVGVAGGSLLATPDTPLLFAWVFTARAVWRAAHDRPRWWGLAGAGLGAGVLGKLSILWLAAGLAWYLFAKGRALRTTGPVLALAIAMVIGSPFLVWNARHQWATIRFTLIERPVHLPPGPSAVADLLAAQFIYAAVLFPVFAWALWAAWRRRADERFRYLFWSAIPAVAVPLAFALTTGTHRNAWMVPAYLVLAVSVAALWNRLTAVATAVAVTAGIATSTLLLLPGFPPIPGLAELHGWEQAGRRAASEVVRLPQPAVLASDRYQAAAQLAYATHARVAITLLPRADPESIWTRLWGPSGQWGGRDAIVVVDPAWPASDWRRYASRVRELRPLVVGLDPQRSRTFLFYRLEGLRPDARGPGPVSISCRSSSGC